MMLPPGMTSPSGVPTAGMMPPGMAGVPPGMAHGMWPGMAGMPGMPNFPAPTPALKSKKEKGRDRGKGKDKDKEKDKNKGKKKDKDKGKRKRKRGSSSSNRSSSESSVDHNSSEESSSCESRSSSKRAKRKKNTKKNKKRHKSPKRKRVAQKTKAVQKSRSRDRRRKSPARSSHDASAMRAAAAAIAAAAAAPTRVIRAASPMYALTPAAPAPCVRSPSPPKKAAAPPVPMTAAEKAAAAAAVVESRAAALDNTSSKASDPPAIKDDAVSDPRTRGFQGPEMVDILSLPKSLIGRVIGKGGSTIKDIIEKTGARVDARDQSQDPVQVLISGTTEAVERAKEMLLDIAEGAAVALGSKDVTSSDAGPVASGNVATGDEFAIVPMPSLAADEGAAAAAALLSKPEERQVVGGDVIEDHMDLPKQATGKIIGTGGKQISEIRQKSGAQVDIDKLPDSCRVRLIGTREQIEEAKKQVNQALEAPAPAAENFPTYTGELMEIPRGAVGRVIGAGGARIQELQERSGSKIDIDRSTEKCMVRFAGAPEAVARAKALVTEVLEGRDRSLGDNVETMEVPPSTTGRLIGPGGKQINEIQERSGAKVDIDKTRDPCIVRICGKEESVAAAKRMVLDVVQNIIAHQPSPQDLQNSIARAAAVAQAARAGLVYLGGAAANSMGLDEESIKFEIPIALADKVLGNGNWVLAMRQRTGARVTVNRSPDKCFLEFAGSPEQVVEAEQMAEEAVKNISVLVANAREPPPPPPPVPLTPGHSLAPRLVTVPGPVPSPSHVPTVVPPPTTVPGMPPLSTAPAGVVVPPPSSVPEEINSNGGASKVEHSPASGADTVRPPAVAPGAIVLQRPPLAASSKASFAGNPKNPASETSVASTEPPPSAPTPVPSKAAAMAAAITLPVRPSAPDPAPMSQGVSSPMPRVGTAGTPGPGDAAVPPELMPPTPGPPPPAPPAPPAPAAQPQLMASMAMPPHPWHTPMTLPPAMIVAPWHVVAPQLPVPPPPAGPPPPGQPGIAP